MFVITIKLRKRLMLGLLAVAVALSGVLVASVFSRSPDSVLTSAVTVEDNSQRIKFLGSYGWTVESEPYEIVEIVIPKKFDAVYDDYNNLQKSQGFDLSAYAGKTVRRYTYRVLNYPAQLECDVYVNMIVYNGSVIGGDVYCTGLTGFMHGFAYSAT